MPTQNTRVKDVIMGLYPSVWEVLFFREVEDLILVRADPKNPLCIIGLSRIIADLYTPTDYVIDVQYAWAKCRYQKMFGNWKK